MFKNSSVAKLRQFFYHVIELSFLIENVSVNGGFRYSRFCKKVKNCPCTCIKFSKTLVVLLINEPIVE